MFNKDQNEFTNPQFENQTGNGDYSVSGVEPVTVKSKGKKAALIGGISAAVIAGGGVTAYGVSDTVKNQVKLRTNSPEKYYAWVTENNSKTIGETVSEYYKKGIDRYEKGTTGKINVSFEPTAEVKDDLIKSMFGDDYEEYADDETKQFIDIFKNNDKYGINAEYASRKGKLSTNMGVALGGDRLAGFELAADPDAMDYFVRIPELKEQWLGMELGSAEELLGTSETINAYKEIMKDPASFLSPEDIENEINRYAGVWASFANDVELEKKEEVDICDITVNYTVATMDLTEKDIAKLGVDMLKELRNDKVVKNILTEKLKVVDEDEYEEDLDDAIDNINDNLKDDYYDDEDAEITIATYIDATGTIRGMKFSEDDNYFLMIVGKDGDSIRGEVKMCEDNEDVFTVNLTAEENGKKYTGDLEITINESFSYDDDNDATTVTVLFENVETVDEEKGYFNGDFTVNIPNVDPIVIKCNADKDGQNITYDAVIGGKNYGKLTVDYSLDFKADIDIPDKGSAYMVDMEKMNDFQLEDYVTSDEFNGFVKGIFVKAGVSEESAGKYSEALTDEVFGEFDNDFDFDDDDFDFDDEDFNFDDIEDNIKKPSDDDTTASSKTDDDRTTASGSSGFSFSNDDFQFDPGQFKYDDFKDYMSEEDFNKMVEEAKKYMDEYEKKAS